MTERIISMMEEGTLPDDIMRALVEEGYPSDAVLAKVQEVKDLMSLRK